MNDKLPKDAQRQAADELRLALKRQVTHPYITGQGLEQTDSPVKASTARQEVPPSASGSGPA